MNGVYQITKTSGTSFTYASAGTAGTAAIAGAGIALDVMSPLGVYSGSPRSYALYVDLGSITMSSSGDGSGTSFGFTINQDVTPSDGPWFNLIPDQTRFRLIKAETGASPEVDKSDVFFTGYLSDFSSEINDSGQGTISEITLQDPNALLDRLIVYGNQLSPKRAVETGGFVRSSNVTTVTTSSAHGYSATQQISIGGVSGGLNKTFNGVFSISTVPTSRTFTYSNAGSATTGNEFQALSSVFLVSKSRNTVIAQGSASLNLNDLATVTIRNVTSNNASAQNLINGTFSGNNVRKTLSSNQIQITLPANVPVGTTFTGGEIKGQPIIIPTGSPDQRISIIRSGESETAAAARMLTIINQYKDEDYALNRLIDTADTTLMVGSSTQLNKASVQIPTTSLRSALDTVVETFSGQDSKERRYYVDPAGRLNYGIADASSAPTYATAPYSIITSGPGTPNTTTGKATIAPYSLTVSWDHDTVKSVAFSPSTNQKQEPVTVQTYTQAGYTDRPGAPLLDEQLDYPTATAESAVQVARAAKTFFLERHKPLLSGSFTLRGSGTQAFNAYGFSSGYAQTGTATFSLVKRWQPGQWVEVVCAQLGLSGLYRVEAVDWSLEPGSYNQIITITFNRKPQNSLTNIISSGGA
jgi:hypothetical protein